MNIKDAPKKLLDDGLLNVIVVLSYEPEYSQVALENRLERSFKDRDESEALVRYSVKNRLHLKKNHTDSLTFLANQTFKIMVTESSISFNIVDKYPGWQAMRTFIDQTLAVLPDFQYKQVSVQYVSRFEEISIFDQLDGNIHLNHFKRFLGSEFTFHYAHNEHDTGISLVDVHLINNVPVPPNPYTASFIDVTVRSLIDQQGEREEMLLRLEMIHQVEYHCFISLLKKEFIDTRKPIYE